MKPLARHAGFAVDDMFELRALDHATLVRETLGLIVEVNGRRRATDSDQSQQGQNNLIRLT